MFNPTLAPFVLLEFPNQRPLFAHPTRVIVAHRHEEVRPALRTIQQATGEGWYAAGYISYEASPAFDIALNVHSTSSRMPLLWFGLFRAPLEHLPRAWAAENLSDFHLSDFHLSEWLPTTSRKRYDRSIAAIRAAIARGETYQVNYTMRLQAQFEGDDFAFYRHLCAAQRPAYGAYLNLGRHRILSASPELFFHWQGNKICTKPMKGTVRRGRWVAEDDHLAAWLAASEKNQAENVMIVDLLRNDLGRVAEIGSVHVPRLFEIERYPTLFQMTSTVCATPRPNLTLEELFSAIFPCGSITGAPKVSTMRIIHELEETPREVYCGAIGFIAPDGEMLFNVAIRTVWLDMKDGLAEYGVGGGITWDSVAEDEYAEAQIKAALLTTPPPTFKLLETMLLEEGQVVLKERHVQRLAESAQYFDFSFSQSEFESALAELANLHSTGGYRLRLLLAREGQIEIESQPIPLMATTEPQPVALASKPVSRHNRFLFHKTTYRTLYDQHRASHPEAWDVLLWNEEGELTEFCIGNLVLELEGEYWTPPLTSGLLPGTQRAELLAHGLIRERVLRRDDLLHAKGIWLINSVRGWVPVLFCFPTLS